MLMGGSVVTLCSLHVLLSTGAICPVGCVFVREGNKNRQILPVRTYKIGLIQRIPGKRVIHSHRKKKKLESPPRELLCSDRAQTSTTSSGRPSCVDVVFGFWLKVLVRRTKFQNRRKFHKYVYTYIDMLKHQTFGVIFRGKARAALTGDAQKCGLSYNTCTKCQGLTLKKRRRLRTGRQF